MRELYGQVSRAASTKEPELFAVGRQTEFRLSCLPPRMIGLKQINDLLFSSRVLLEKKRALRWLGKL